MKTTHVLRVLACATLCFLFFGKIKAQDFLENAAASNLNHAFSASGYMGGGMCWFDYDNDGLEDLFLTGGNNGNRLFRNVDGLTFEDKTAQAGLTNTLDYNCIGAISGDIDNDGDRDLFVMTFGQPAFNQLVRNLLYINNGQGEFVEYGITADLDTESFTMSAVFLDANGDGFLDLQIGNYVEEHNSIYDEISGKFSFDHTCYEDQLYLNDGDKSFTPASTEFCANNTGCTLALASTDYNRDQLPDIMAANDFGEFIVPNQLLQNTGEGFVNVSAESNSDVQLYGMGIAIGDYDEDQDLDYYITNLGRNVLLENQGDGTFEDVTASLGLENTGEGDLYSTGWGTFFFDYDNDTRLDLFVSNGHIPSIPPLNNFLEDPNRLYHRNADGTFTDVSETEFDIVNTMISRGCAYADINNDGLLDFSVANVRTSFEELDPFTFYLNRNEDEFNWLKFDLEGQVVNRDGYGSIVEVYAGERTFVRELNGGSSHGSQNTSKLHFGLGTIAEVDSAKVFWPGGNQQAIAQVSLNAVNYVLEDTLFYHVPIEPKDTTTTDTMGTDMISKIDLLRNLRLYPNPFAQKLFVECDLQIADKIVLTLKTIHGTVVEQTPLTKTGSRKNTFVYQPTHILAEGLYLVELSYGENRVCKKVLYRRE